jgi:hypothetical protein
MSMNLQIDQESFGHEFLSFFSAKLVGETIGEEVECFAGVQFDLCLSEWCHAAVKAAGLSVGFVFN